MIQCLYPDCDFAASTGAVERDKRTVVAHCNSHAEAHVLIACSHELEHVEDFTIHVQPHNAEPYDEPNRRYQCVRCGDFVVDVVPTEAASE